MRLTVVTCSYFKKYVQREIAKATGYSIYKPLQGWRHRRKREWIYTENPPWTDAGKDANKPKMKLQEFIEPIAASQWKIFKGDRVQILNGVDRGKVGIVCLIVKERNWCFVEGLNCEYQWSQKSSTNPGIIQKKERPLLVTTEVALLDPSDQQPTEVEWRYDEAGERVRVSLRSGRILPMSEKTLSEAEDGTLKSSYNDQPCDTSEKDLTKVTFKPSLSTFEQDIMKAMGIKEDRKRAPNFYY